MKQYVGNVKEAISQLLNTVLGGYPDEMFSARCFRTQSRLLPFVDLIFGVGHCKRMYKYEWARKSQHPHYK